MFFLSLSAWTKSVSTEQIFMKFTLLGFFENLSRKFKFYINLTALYMKTNVQGVSGGIVNILRDCSMEYSEKISSYKRVSNF